MSSTCRFSLCALCLGLSFRLCLSSDLRFTFRFWFTFCRCRTLWFHFTFWLLLSYRRSLSFWLGFTESGLSLAFTFWLRRSTLDQLLSTAYYVSAPACLGDDDLGGDYRGRLFAFAT
jgi:hypothetical protein